MKKVKIGILGVPSDEYRDKEMEMARELGEYIAKSEAVLVFYTSVFDSCESFGEIAAREAIEYEGFTAELTSKNRASYKKTLGDITYFVGSDLLLHASDEMNDICDSVIGFVGDPYRCRKNIVGTKIPLVFLDPYEIDDMIYDMIYDKSIIKAITQTPKEAVEIALSEGIRYQTSFRDDPNE